MIVSSLLLMPTASSLLSQVASSSISINGTISKLSLTVWCGLSVEGTILPHEASPVSSSGPQAIESAAITRLKPTPLVALDRARFTYLCD